MGSFNTTCCLSGVVIDHGMRFTRIYLVPAWDYYQPEKATKRGKTPACFGHLDFYNKKGVAVSNEGAYAMFCPFGFPVRFTYEDCGQGVLWKDAENDARLKQLTDFFGIDYATLETATSDDRWIRYADDKMWRLKREPKHREILERMTHCDVLTSVYEYFAAAKRPDLEARDEKWISEQVAGLDAGSLPMLFPLLCRLNFINEFEKAGMLDWKPNKPRIAEWIRFSARVSAAMLVLRPSHYGGQEDNHAAITGMNRVVKNTLDEMSGRR